MMKFRSLTNVRPTKDLGCQVIASPTYGQFKVTPDAAKVLKVGDKDYLSIVMDEDNNPYAVKGAEGNGGKLASANKQGGGILTFSASNAWEELKGDSGFNIFFTMDADAVVSIPATDEEGNEIEGEPTLYFPLTVSEKVAKQVRKKKNAEGVEEEVEVEVDEADEAPESFENM